MSWVAGSVKDIDMWATNQASSDEDHFYMNNIKLGTATDSCQRGYLGGRGSSISSPRVEDGRTSDTN